MNNLYYDLLKSNCIKHRCILAKYLILKGISLASPIKYLDIMRIFQTVLFTFLYCLFCLSGLQAQDKMNNKKLEKTLKKITQEIEGETGNWQVLYQEFPLFVLTDEASNRMRIFTPILEEEELKVGQMKKMLEANFHSALDAKYSLYEGFVIGIYTHPLVELNEKQMEDAMSQVVNLSKNFGTSYTSTDVMFGHSAQSTSSNKLKKS